MTDTRSVAEILEIDLRDEPSRLEKYVPRIATEWDQMAEVKSWQELDATLCFIDIAGFTALSERLARRGPIGAEELTEVLDRVFTNMLEVSYLQGGSLLKFGGDALLLIFTGHDHALRGASAAVEMRTALRAAADNQTSVGRLRLRMSVGIHSGPIHLFRAGKSHQELVIAGPGTTTTTAMENTADAGEIVVSDGTRNALPPEAATVRKGDGWILKWRRPRCVPSGSLVRSHPDQAKVREWVPETLRDYLALGVPEPEHRVASVGFIRFGGVDHLVETEGVAEAAVSIDETIGTIQDAADEEGVTFLATDINPDGGKIIVVTGAPTAKEEDEGRLLRMLRRVADSEAPLELHFGVNQGHVFTGEIGSDYRATYTVMGDTVNLAARLAGIAPEGTVYATPGILDNSGVLFACQAVEPFYVKGKEELVHAYEVEEELGERAVDTSDELPIVGRREELAVVIDVITSALSGQGEVLSVIGEPGSGKSRLVREACLACTAVTAIGVRSESYGATSPYRPLRDVMRSLFGIERDEQPVMAEALEKRIGGIDPDLLSLLPFFGDVTHIDVAATPTVDAIEPRFRQDRLADAMIRLLDLLLNAPTVFDVEDAQWMDDASAHLMGRIAGESASHPWSMLISRRGREGGFLPEHGEVMELSNLASSDAETLVIEATAAAPLRPHELKAIVARAGGNPLFLVEILQVVRETGSVEALPDSLGSVVSTSIDALPPLTRRILRYSSVLGRSFRTETVNEILAEDHLEMDAVTRSSLRRFLMPDGRGRLKFSNAMVRDVAYDGLSFRRRRELHLRAATAIEGSIEDPEDAADLLAMHYSIGNEHERAWHYSRIAGHQARNSFANVEAATQYERALESARRLAEVSDDDRLHVWADLGDVRERAGLLDGALDAYRRATWLAADDVVAKAELMLKRASTREKAAQYAMALSETTKARRLAEHAQSSSASVVAATADAFYAFVRMRQEKPREALLTAQAAVKKAENVGAKAALARAYSVIAWAHLMADDPGAEDWCRQALELYEDLGDLVGQNDMNNNLGVLAYFDGRWDEALKHYERSRTEAEQLGNVVDVGFVEANIGEVLVNQLRLDEAEARLSSAARTLRASGEMWTATFAEIHLGRVMTERGDLEQAERLFRRTREEMIAFDFGAGAFEGALYLADCLIRQGQPADALELLDEAVQDAGDEATIFAPTQARIRAKALAELGQVEDSIYQAERGLEAARSRTLNYEMALLLLFMGTLMEQTSPRQATTYRTEASEILGRLNIRIPSPVEASVSD